MRPFLIIPIAPLSVGEEGELGGWKEAEGEAVVGCGAVGGYGRAVVGCGVAFVDGPVVGGILVVEAAHDVVAVGLGEDGGGGDVAVAAVSFDEGLPGDVAPGMEFVAVDDDAGGREAAGGGGDAEPEPTPQQPVVSARPF